MTSSYVPRRPHRDSTAPAALAREAARRDTGRAGSSMLIIGPAGAGQRKMLQQVEQRAKAAGRSTVSMWVTPNQPPMMFALALEEIVGVAAQESLAPADVARRLRQAMRNPTAPNTQLTVLMHGIQELPEEDAAIVESLLCAPPSGPVHLVATVSERRADGRRWPALTALRERAQGEARCEVVELARLSAEQVERHIEATLGPGAAATRFVRELTASTNGYLDDIQDWLDVIQDGDVKARQEILAASQSLHAVPPPDSVRTRVRSALHGLPDQARLLASALAVWQRNASPAVLARLSEFSDVEIEDGLSHLLDQGIAREATGAGGRVAFRAVSGVVAQAIAAETRPLTRARLHRRAAATLDEDALGRPLTEEETIALAEHVLQGGFEEVDPRAIDQVAASARLLVTRGRFADARTQLRDLAQQLRPADAERTRDLALPPDLAALLAETLSRSGELEAAREILTQRIETQGMDPAAVMRRARDQVALARDADAWKEYEPLLARGNASLDPDVTRARIEASRVLHSLGLIDEAVTQCEQAHEEALRMENPQLGSLALIALHSVNLTGGRPHQALLAGRESYRLARESRDPAAIARATSAIGNALFDGESLTRGLRWVRRAMRLGEAADDFPSVSWTGIRVALGLIDLGDLAEAEKIALRIMHMDAGLHRLRPLPRSHSVLRVVHALRGQARNEASPAVQFWHGWERLDMSHALTQEAVALYTERMAAGDAAGAHEAVSIVIDWFTETTGRGRFLIGDLLPRQVESALRMGDQDAAVAAVGRFEAIRERTDDFTLSRAEYQHALGRLAQARGDWVDALDALTQAAHMFEETGYRWRHARAIQDLAELHIALDQRELAGPLLDQAHEFFAMAGADLRDIRELYGRAGRRAPRRRGAGDLSEREIEVARLAARGMTDAEIALDLGIQRRTVTTHMHNILSKRGLRSRLELRHGEAAG